MKKTIITILSFLGLLIIVFILVKTYIKHEDVKEAKAELIADVKKNFKIDLSPGKPDSLGNKHYVTRSGQNTFKRQEIDNNPHILDNTIVDSLARLLKISQSEIVSLKQINIELKGKLKAQQKKDSVGNEVNYYKDPFISIAYSNGFFDYSENFKLNQIEHPTKKFLWIRYGNVIDFSSDNPRAVINSVKTFTVVPNPSVWSFKLSCGANYDFGSKIITPLAQASLGFKDWNLNGGVTYSWGQQNDIGFNPFIGIQYNFINLK